MEKIKKTINFLFHNPAKLFRICILEIMRMKGIRLLVSAKLFIKYEYKLCTGQKLNIGNLKTFNEKLQWLKLGDKNPLYTKLVDKYEIRQYIKNKIGEQYLIPLIGVYNNVDEIPFSQLPEQYVLKCTHDSGTAIIKNLMCTMTEKEIKQKLKKALKRNYYYEHREWAYKNIPPRIICEQYMVDESNVELKDYKIHCFDGKPKLIQVDFDRFTNHRRNLFDIEWNYIDASIKYPNDPTFIIEKPINLESLIRIASVLSMPFSYVRVDLYIVKTRIYFGELTFDHGAGYEKFQPSELGFQMGNWVKLP